MEKPVTIKEMAALGGKARAAKLSKKRLSQIARQAINTRWKRHRKSLRTKKAGT
jgi:hypothetical protein